MVSVDVREHFNQPTWPGKLMQCSAASLRLSQRRSVHCYKGPQCQRVQVCCTPLVDTDLGAGIWSPLYDVWQSESTKPSADEMYKQHRASGVTTLQWCYLQLRAKVGPLTWCCLHVWSALVLVLSEGFTVQWRIGQGIQKNIFVEKAYYWEWAKEICNLVLCELMK